MRNFEPGRAYARPHKVYRHKESGRVLSMGGACPWWNQAQAAEWEIVQIGFTVQYPDGTSGHGVKNGATESECEAIAESYNRRMDSIRAAAAARAAKVAAAGVDPVTVTIDGVRCLQAPAAPQYVAKPIGGGRWAVYENGAYSFQWNRARVIEWIRDVARSQVLRAMGA